MLAQAARHAQPAGGIAGELQDTLVAWLAGRCTSWLRLNDVELVGGDGHSVGQHEHQDEAEFYSCHLNVAANGTPRREALLAARLPSDPASLGVGYK